MTDERYIIGLTEDAERTVEAFIERHRAAAIPAIVGYCAMWAVENGGMDVMKGTLANAALMMDEMQKARTRDAQ